MINKKENIFVLWTVWQFNEMPKFLVLVWKNYLMFAVNFFSVPLLLKTFIAPWKRYSWVYPKGFQVGEFLSTLISNFFSRIIGAMIRTILIIVGIIFQIFVFVAGLLVVVGWVVMPFLIILGFIYLLYV